jgi:catechol 2,3-dioxygenase-like lactoylglutathione lyase family enzyme
MSKWTKFELLAFLPFAIFAIFAGQFAFGQSAALPAPGFHHLHLNATNPEAAIAFYTLQFPSTTGSTFAGQPALKTGNVWILFNKVSSPPKTSPQTAIWHFGWHVVDERKNLAMYQQRKQDVKLLPLYTGDGDGSVLVSSDTWPGTGGVLGLTKAQIADAKAKGIKPAGGAGFAYMQGPDNALIEYQGNMPRERFNHVHMYQDEPLCAQAWYVKHLNAAPRPGVVTPPENDCKAPRGERTWPALEKEGMLRAPAGGVLMDDVAVNWYVNQGKQPLAPTRGQLYDHFGLSVANLDAWIAKLRGEGVRFLAQPYKLGTTRAVMVEGPSKEAIELIEVGQ